MVGEGEGKKRMETEMYEGGKEKNGIRDGKKRCTSYGQELPWWSRNIKASLKLAQEDREGRGTRGRQ